MISSAAETTQLDKIKNLHSADSIDTESLSVDTSPEARTPPSGWSTRVVSVTTVATICPTA